MTKTLDEIIDLCGTLSKIVKPYNKDIDGKPKTKRGAKESLISSVWIITFLILLAPHETSLR